MHAFQLTQPRSFVPVQTPSPKPDKGQILVKTKWVALCGSDIPYFTGRNSLITYPLEAGAQAHECVGQVIESDSDQFYPEDWVLAMPEGNCGLAEMFVAQVSKAVNLPADLNDYSSSCLIQPLATVMNAVDRLGEIRGQRIAVIGLGPIGLLFCWLLNIRGAGKIIGIDPCEHRCTATEKLGATETFPVRSVELIQKLKKGLHSWEAPEICVEAVGHQVETLNDCIELVSWKGKVLAFGVPDQSVYAFAFETFFRKNVVLIASVTPDWPEYLSKARDLFLSHRTELESIITHKFPIRNAGEAFSLYETHQDGILKGLLDATHW
jgi:threonine dehydrogenase-like Zn-dependent dehydrogenase